MRNPEYPENDVLIIQRDNGASPLILNRPSKRVTRRRAYGVVDEQQGNDWKDDQGAEIQIGDLLDIDVSLLREPELKPRSVYPAEEVLELATSLESQGQLVPGVVRKDPNAPGFYVVVDGMSRFKAIREHGVCGGIFRAELRHFDTDLDAFWFGYDANEKRRQHTTFDRAMALIQARQADPNMTQEELAQRAGLKQSAVSALLSIEALPDDGRILLATNAPDTPYEIYMIARSLRNTAGDTACMELLRQVVENGLTVAQTRDLKTALSTPQSSGEGQQPGGEPGDSNNSPLAGNKPQVAERLYGNHGKLVLKKRGFSLTLKDLEPESANGLMERIDEVVQEFLAKRETQKNGQ